MGNISASQPQLRPLNEIVRPQQSQPAPVQQQYPQPAPVQQQPAAPGTMSVEQLTDMNQLQRYQNNGRVEVVIQDRTRGHFVISADALNLAALDQQTGGIGLGQELRLFDANNDGWIVEAELQTATATVPSGEKASTGEHVASSTLGGAMFGGIVLGGTGLGAKIGSAMGGKFAGMKGWVIGAGIGAVAGVVGGLLTKPKPEAQQPAATTGGYRPDTQWDANRLAKTVL